MIGARPALAQATVEELGITWPVWQVVLFIALYVAVVISLGGYARIKRVDLSEQDFFVTKWSTGWIGISFSIAATFASAGYVMGTIGEFYANPPALTGYLFGALLSPLALWVVGRRLWPIARRDGYITYTDFIGDFYRSERLRVVVSVLVVVFFAPYFAVNLMAPGLLLQALTGGAIPYSVGVIGMAVVGVGYTLLGGMRGVIWTDILQALVMYVVFLLIIPIAVAASGGFGEMIQSVPEQAFAYELSAETWMLVLSWGVLIALMQPSNPDRAFRLLTAKNLQSVRTGALASVVLLGLWSFIGLLLGWSFNVAIPGVETTDMVMPVGIVELASWLMPLFLMALWAGGMSTLDSGIMAVTAMLTKDVYHKNINRQATPSQIARLRTVLILLFGLFAVFVALAEPPFLWYFIAAAAAVAMQWLPALLFGLYWKRATTAAAWCGIIGGIAVTALFQYVIDSPWPGPAGPAIMGFAVNIPLYVIVALRSKPLPGDHLERYQGVFRAPARATAQSPR